MLKTVANVRAMLPVPVFVLVSSVVHVVLTTGVVTFYTATPAHVRAQDAVKHCSEGWMRLG